MLRGPSSLLLLTLACALSLARASEELVPETGWRYYVGFDSLSKQDYQVHEGSIVEKSHPTDSRFPHGPPPVDCYDICFEDPECHGFVLNAHRCWFRGGGEEGPRHLYRVKRQRNDMSLFIIYGTHPTAPVLDDSLARNVHSLLPPAVAATLIFLVLLGVAIGVHRAKQVKETSFPLFVPAPEKQDRSGSRGCDSMICGASRKSGGNYLV